MKKYLYFCLILFLLLLPLPSVSAAETENTSTQAQSEESADQLLSAQSSQISSSQSKTETKSETVKSTAAKTTVKAATATASTAKSAAVTTTENKTTTSTTQSATVTNEETAKSCTITVSAGNGQLVLSDGTALSGSYDTDADLSAIILPNRGYSIPQSVTVSAASGELDASNYSYSSETGVLALPASILDGNLSVSFSCVELSPVTTIANTESTTDSETVQAPATPATEEAANTVVEASEVNPGEATIDTDARNLHAIYLLSALFCAGGALYLMLFILHRTRKEERLKADQKPGVPKAQS